MKKVRLLLTMLSLVFPMLMMAGDFKAGKQHFLLNGEPFIIKAAEVHYPRIPRPYWEHRIQMCKSLGMNTLCIYAFWNFHEQQMDQFAFSGQADVAEFCRLAQKNGMYVIVRPGPYACAEWEMGGLPWWLLKKKDIRLREQDPSFMERAKLFEEKLAEQLRPLAIYNGGPIIMVQVENEYGSYGEDKPYMSAMRDIVRSAWGKEMTLFQCDWSSNFEKNGLDDLNWTMNFGTGANIDEQFRRLKELRPDAPLMCSEFWSGWFDKWGARHETRPAKEMVDGLNEMLSKGISFSLYMTHGGTSFGHWAGANSPGFAPDVTSYDYDAPINEFGGATDKYYQLRKMMQKYSKEPLPEKPAPPMMMINIPPFELTERADILLGVDSLVMDTPLQTMEEMDQGWGSMLYVATMPEISQKSVLTLNDCHDFAQVFIDTVYIGKIDRVRHEKSIQLPPVKKGQELRILIEAMGRINFGRAIKDFKGITESVTITAEDNGHELTWNLKKWNIFTIPDDYQTAVRALETAKQDSLTAMSNMAAFGKGQVYVNGHAIGRFWSVGPQQTLYVPGCWLKKGKNEVVVLDVIGPSLRAYYLTKDKKRLSPFLAAQNHPELDQLNVEESREHNDPGKCPDLNSVIPAAEGQLAAGNGWQTIRFSNPRKGRYVAIEALSTQADNSVVAVAELYLRDEAGDRLSREPWTVRYADSEDVRRGNFTGEKVYDLQESTYWRTAKETDLPHLLVIDLGSVQTVSALDYLPRAEQGAPGSIKDYRIYVY